VLASAIQGFGFWAAILAAFWKLEDIISPAAKMALSDWIKRVNVSPSKGNWSTHFLTIFEIVFGSRPDTPQFLKRSCIASLCSVAVMLAVWYSIHPSDANIVISHIDLDALWYFVMMILFVNIPADYLAYIKTYYILILMRGQNMLFCFVSLFIDFSLTFFIFAVCAAFLFMAVKSGYGLGSDGWEWREAVIKKMSNTVGSILHTALSPAGLLLKTGYVEISIPPAGILLYSTFFTTAWALLHFISVVVTRLVLLIGSGISWLKWVLDIDERPLRSLGFIAGGLVAIAYWIVLAVALLLQVEAGSAS
jgi:hypothetical protein